MRLELGRRTDYAIRATVDLAHHHGDGRRKGRAIADAMAIPTSYVPQILAELVRAQLVRSVAGREGGYELARPPSEISLFDVVHAAEGDVVSTECILRGGPCSSEDACAAHAPWSQAQHALLDSLAATSLADLLGIDKDVAAGGYANPSELRWRTTLGAEE